MKILLTNLFLQGYTGSESFVHTLGKALREQGHEVTFYVHNWGWFGDQVRKEGFECWFNPNAKGYKLPHTNFDVVHFQHQETVAAIYDQVKHIPKMFISHGMLPQPEQPLPYHSHPMEGYAGVSEETLENVMNKSGAVFSSKGVKTTIIRNIIDTERFSTPVGIEQEPKNVLIISNYMRRTPQYIALVKQACEMLGLTLQIIGDAGQRVRDTRPYIEKADIVIGIGRCAYEAMSMGRNVLVFDYQGLEGMIESRERYELFRRNNLSGRYRNKKDVTINDVIQEIKRYSPHNGNLNRNIILTEHEARAVAKGAESFYKSLI